MDFHAGRINREHSDVDFIVALRHRDPLIAALTEAGFTPVASDAPNTVQRFVCEDMVVEVTFVVRRANGRIVTPGFEHWPWLDGALSDQPVEFSGVQVHVVSAAALLDTKLGWVSNVGDEPRQHDLADIKILRRSVERL